ncbi:VOC family protein [Desertihabitans brevis]|uniref:VOC family protein n=1 Tax=Desertihabitans brevis TaxID=2268447 RepID=A0A367YUL1_9ACTN|nr:VOC family protein [Desertihabitans brevis]RCK68712.1 VOC family protein [Desertihabitans brevis]
MTMQLAMVTVDSDDPGPLARWWAEQVGGQVVQDFDGGYVMVGLPDGQPALAFQKVDDPTPGKNRIHLDLTADTSVEAEAERLVRAGATEVGRHEAEGFRWVTLADPQGNQFCVAEGH